MSTSDKTKQSKKMPKVIWYLLGAVFCVIFNRVYAQFSHGVSSSYMSYMYLIPLVGGVLGFFLKMGEDWDGIFLSYSVLTLTLGSCLQGVFEIAGTESPYMVVYAVAGSACLILSFVLHFLIRFGTMKRKK